MLPVRRNLQYNPTEEVILWMNTVGPYHNRQETYSFFTLPFCKGPKTEIGHHHESLGEALQVICIFSCITPATFPCYSMAPPCSLFLPSATARHAGPPLSTHTHTALHHDADLGSGVCLHNANRASSSSSAASTSSLAMMLRRRSSAT